MGRSFESVRMGVKDVSARWMKASKALKKEDQVYGQKLAEMTKKHSSEPFYALDDPLEAAIFSVLVEMVKELDEVRNERNEENLAEEKSTGRKSFA
jgi:predicted secreted Zn-dependent protease